MMSSPTGNGKKRTTSTNAVAAQPKYAAEGRSKSAFQTLPKVEQIDEEEDDECSVAGRSSVNPEHS